MSSTVEPGAPAARRASAADTIAVRTVALRGLEPVAARIVATVKNGPPAWKMPGATEAKTRETRVRVACAVSALGVLLDGFSVTLEAVGDAGPCEWQPHFDLPAAVALLAVLGRCPAPTHEALVGELSLEGKIRPVRGALPMAGLSELRLGEGMLVAPSDNAPELALARRGKALVRLAPSLAAVLDYFGGSVLREPPDLPAAGKGADHLAEAVCDERTEKAVVELRLQAIAGAGRVLIVGNYGLGASALARAAALTIADLPLDATDRATVASIQSAAGLFPTDGRPVKRPLRAPHHTVSEAGLVGANGRPGEATLAHLGVLLLDELDEFRKGAIESLSRVLGERKATMRAGGETVSFPAKPWSVIATARRCPCGMRLPPGGDLSPRHRFCRCSEESVARHAARLGDLVALLGLVKIDL